MTNIRGPHICFPYSSYFQDHHLIVKDAAYDTIEVTRNRFKLELESTEKRMQESLQRMCEHLGDGHPWGPWHNNPWESIIGTTVESYSRTCLRCGSTEYSEEPVEGAIQHPEILR